VRLHLDLKFLFRSYKEFTSFRGKQNGECEDLTTTLVTRRQQADLSKEEYLGGRVHVLSDSLFFGALGVEVGVLEGRAAVA
jgi:hypothetical protein